MPVAARDRNSVIANLVRIAEAIVVLVALLASAGLFVAGVLAFSESFQPTPPKEALTAISGRVERAGRELVRYQRLKKNGPSERIEENYITVRFADGGNRMLAVPRTILAAEALEGLVGRDVTVRTFYGNVWSIEMDGLEIATYADAARRHEDGRPYARIYGPLAALSGALGLWLALRMRSWLARRRRAILGN